MSKLSYRPDIDGLRALAVIPVVLYHFGGTAFTGGYVGVDIFFVISGYLITSIILKEQAVGDFSLLRFYERRIRRILPALFTVLVVSTIAGFLFLFPPDLEYFGRALAATAGFGSNFLFWQESGYFQPAAITVPLLHTWSLAVEEQFYIFMPLVLMFTHRFCPRLTLPLITLAIAVSMGLCLFAISMKSYAALFYLLPTRAWELLVGSGLAFVSKPSERLKFYAPLLFAIGTGLIFYAIIAYDNDTIFPGPAALLPTVGAALILYAGLYENVFSRMVLGNKIAVFFGKISYSLYLWHWPVIVYLQYRLPVETSLITTAGLFAACTLLAYITWRFVENPVRNKSFLSRRTLFIAAFLVSILFIGGGLFISKEKGFPHRFPADVLELYKVSTGGIFPAASDKPEASQYSGMLGADMAVPSFLLWGDSHAESAAPGVDVAARKLGKRGYLVGYHSCVPSYVDVAIAQDACNASNRSIVEWLRKHPEIKTVLLVGHWSNHDYFYARHHQYGRTESPTLLRDTLGTLMDGLHKDGKRIVFMMDPPHAPVFTLPLYVARAKHYNIPLDLKYDLSRYEEQEAGINAALEDLKNQYDFKVYNLAAKFCPDGTCPLTVDGQPVFRDYNHFSTYAAVALSDMFLPLFE